MKIMLITDAWTPQINGVVITLGQTLKHLEQQGHQVYVVHPGLFRTIPCPGYAEIRLALGAGAKTAALIRQYQPDALHIATEGPLGYAAWRYARQQGIPFTTAYHTRFPEYLHARLRLPLRLSYRFLKRFHGAATRTLVPSPGVREELVAQGFQPHKLVLWSRGVDTRIFHPTPAPQDSTPSEHSNTPIFLYAGRLAIEKNVEAFLKLDLSGQKWLVGDGPLRAQLEKRYPAAHFVGAKTHAELAHFYRKASVFVFPSQTDTFGLVLLEAMACGCPVAALPSVSTAYVLGTSQAGCMNADLRAACLQALTIPRTIPASYAKQFSWASVAQSFADNLAPVITTDTPTKT